jgi:hypothetical protein
VPVSGHLLVAGAERREVARQSFDHELEDALGSGEVLQRLIAQVAQGNGRDLLVIDDSGRRAREQDLAAVRDRADPSRPMDGDPHVPFVAGVSLARVKAHAHRDPTAVLPRLTVERALGRDCGRHGVAGMFEHDEEGVSLRIDFRAAVLNERSAQQRTMGGEHCAVLLAESLDQPRRTVHVGEQKSDGAARRLRHETRIFALWCVSAPQPGAPTPRRGVVPRPRVRARARGGRRRVLPASPESALPSRIARACAGERSCP